MIHLLNKAIRKQNNGSKRTFSRFARKYRKSLS